jgi:uncharacterized protein YprB with RNaseH-like and TPR domain
MPQRNRVCRPVCDNSSVIDLRDLFGWDATSGIVSVDADGAGRARVWRRVDDRVELTEHQFPNWFLTTSLELVAHLDAQPLSGAWLRTADKPLARLEAPLSIVELDWSSSEAEDAYRYLILTTRLAEVETALVETANKRYGGDAQGLSDLRGLVLCWPPIEQFLMLTGRTYFRGMAFDAQRRMQFDLETTGLNEDRDRIFMISMRDSTGWHDCLDTATLSEAQVIQRFVEIVRMRDPDTFENHNIFGFDLSFLVKRAARLGVRLALGRDGSEPWLETDVFDPGERPEPFLRWRVAGREVLDTQHAVRRFGVAAPDMRRHGLKEAARYFGFARSDREYVPGAEVWPTYRTDPERIRRYATDDVDEVDGLSRRLLPAAFELATMLPRSYERVAADNGAASLWEPLLVRAYLRHGRAISAPSPRLQRAAVAPSSELFVRGVVGPAVQAVVGRLLPSVIADRQIAAVTDELGVMPLVVRELLTLPESDAARILASAAHAYLSSQGLFSDPLAASEAAAAARVYTDQLLGDVRRHGGLVVEVSGEQVLFGVGDDWSPSKEAEVIEAARSYLPPGVELSYTGRYQSLYARGPGAAMTLGFDGAVTLIGPAFRAGRLERFGEAFLHRAAECALRSDVVGLREIFLETVHLLRSDQIPLEDLSVQVTLHKSLQQYRRGGTHEEPYEALLAAGVRSWRVGQRIRYFRAHDGEPRLLQEGDGLTGAAADSEYYVQRLCGLYCQQFAQAFAREDFSKIFRLPSGVGPFDEPEMAVVLGAIRPMKTLAGVPI